MSSPVSAKLADLQRRFADQLAIRLDAIRTQFQNLGPATWQIDEVEALHRQVHGLTGSAGTFGFPSVSDAAREMEDRIAILVKARKPPTESGWQAVGLALNHLERTARQGISTRSPSLERPAVPIRLESSPLIYLIEDDPEQSEHMTLALKADGYRVLAFADLATFRTRYFAASGDERPAAVLMDMIFPEGQDAGAAAIAELGLGHETGIPVVVFSVRDDLAGRLAAFRAGACRYLVKPVDPGQLCDLLDAVTGRQPPKPYRVLMVDDDPLLLEAQATVLQEAGMDVCALSQPLRFIELLDKFRPDVVVLDMYMPDASGPELAAVVRERDGSLHLPILFLSSETDISRQLLALKLGGDDFLVKPADPDHLVSAVVARARRARQASTIHRRLQTTLYEREREHLAVNHHALVSIADPAGTIIYANDRLCDVGGYLLEELLGQNYRAIKSGLHLPEFFGDLWRTIARGEIWQGEICNRRKDGSLYWTLSTITPFLGENGKPYQYVSISTDISERKKAETELIAAREESDRANRAKSEFLSSMSHELRTPMNAILGFAQLLEGDSVLSDEQQDGVSEILKAGYHLLELINEVLDLATVESGRVMLSLEAVALSSVIDECLTLVSPLADKRGIRIDSAGMDQAVVRADRMRLKQVLLNLLSNAIKYNRDGGYVKIEAIPEGKDRVRICVTDTGSGIAPSKLPELFKPFNRLGAESSDIEGTGIGLTITRRIVELMDGKVDVKSEVGVGSSFWIELPRSLDSGPLTDPDIAAAGTPGLPLANSDDDRISHKILYVEDNPANLKLVTQILERRKHVRLLTAHNPELGIELARAHRPDLILLDINMGDMDGYQVLRVLKAEASLKQVPVIAVTASAFPREVERGMAAGFSDYLTKPLNVNVFLKTLDRFLSAPVNSAAR